MAAPSALHVTPVQAAVRTWTGLGATNNWSEAANWSGNAVPGAADTVTFDATSTKDATIGASTSVLGVAINAGYTGTVIQASANTLTVGASGFVQSDGTFSGGSGSITVNGGFTLSAGSFTSTTGTLRVTAAFTLSGGTFAPNGGTVAFATSTANIDLAGTKTFANVTFVSAAKTILAGSTMVVGGALTLTDGTLNTGTLEAQGDLSQAATYDGGTASLLINGAAAQTFTGSATSTAGQLPNLVIDKPSGTLTLAGTIRTARNWTYTAGTLDAGTSTVIFAGGTITGSQTLNAVDLGASRRVAAGTTLTTSGALTHTAGTLTLSGAAIVGGALTLTNGTLNTGTLQAQGNLSQASTYDGGTASLLINGSAAQTFTGSATSTAGALPNLVIDKPSGTLTLAGTIRTARDWTYTAGTLDAGSSTLVFAGGTITGSQTLNAVDFRASSSVAAGSTLVVGGALTLTNGTLNTGTLQAQGNRSQAGTCEGGGGSRLI